MGTDMHLMIQEKSGVPDMGTPEWDRCEHVWQDVQPLTMQRDYNLFAYLAGVRCEIPEMGIAHRGLPYPMDKCEHGLKPEEEIDGLHDQHHIRLDQLIIYLRVLEAFCYRDAPDADDFRIY